MSLAPPLFCLIDLPNGYSFPQAYSHVEIEGQMLHFLKEGHQLEVIVNHPILNWEIHTVWDADRNLCYGLAKAVDNIIYS